MAPTVMQLSKLRSNPRKPVPSLEQVNAMVESIRSAGRIMRPIDVRAVSGGYEIEDGETRRLAAIQLKLDIVPIRVLDIDSETSHALALITNLEREQLDPAEVVSNLERLIAEFGRESAVIVLEQLSSLQDHGAVSDELQLRIDALLLSCGLDKKP
nr:ParB N-terminal domain-containing protein [Pseudomonas fluorescens]